MDFIAVAFRSRSHTVRYSEFLRRNGVYCQIVNTPKEAGVGCGLSARLAVRDLSAARKGVRLTAFDSFAGIFLVKTVGGRRIVRSI